MPRLLMLAHRPPNPPDKGDKIRSHHVLRHLSRRFDVTLGCLVDDASDLAHLDGLRAYAAQVGHARIDGLARRVSAARALATGQPVTVAHFHHGSLQRQVDAWIDDAPFDAVFCYSSPMAEYLFRSRHLEGRLRGARRVMDLIDADSVKWAQYADDAPPWTSWLYRREARTLSRYERRIVDAFDRTFLVSRAEAALLGDDPRLGAYANGVDLDYFAPASPAQGSGPTEIVFTGVMDYRPNVEGVQWFAEEILPRVRARLPDARFVIVGSRPSPAVRRLAERPGIVVTGRVPDVRAFVGPAAVCVAPLRIARGLQNKVLEAMAMAKPVVATSQAFEGIDAVAGRDACVVDAPEAFADAVVGLVEDRARASAMGRSARAAMERAYRWDQVLGPLREALSAPAGALEEVAA